MGNWYVVDRRDLGNLRRFRDRAMGPYSKENALLQVEYLHDFLRRNNGGSDLGKPFYVIDESELPVLPPRKPSVKVYWKPEDIHR